MRRNKGICWDGIGYNLSDMVTQEQETQVLEEVIKVRETMEGRDAIIQGALYSIVRNLPDYDWVGVYFHDNGMLNLGPFVGADTEHRLIPVGTGVCGVAVALGENQIVEDVRKLDNYLTCSDETLSEIVVLIRDPETKAIIGQIDADSHKTGAFDVSDERLLVKVAEHLAPYLLLEPEAEM